MSKDGEFKYKEEEQRLVAAEAETLHVAGDAKEEWQSLETTARSVEPSAERPESPGARREAPGKRPEEPYERPLQSQARRIDKNKQTREPRKDRRETQGETLTLIVIFATCIAVGGTGLGANFRLLRGGVHSAIGGAFGAVSQPYLESQMDLVEVLNKKQRYAEMKKVCSEVLTRLESAGIHDARSAYFELRAALAAPSDDDKSVVDRSVMVAKAASKAMKLVPEADKKLAGSLGVPPRMMTNSLVDLGTWLEEQGDYAAALPILESALSYWDVACGEGTRTNLLCNLAECYSHTGNYQRAFECYSTAYNVTKNWCHGDTDFNAYRLREMCHMKARMHQYKEAVEYGKLSFDMYNKINPKYKEGLILWRLNPYAEALIATGSYTEAESLLRTAARQLNDTDPKHSRYLIEMDADFLLAKCLAHRGKSKEAISLIDQVLKDIDRFDYREVGDPVPNKAELLKQRKALGGH